MSLLGHHVESLVNSAISGTVARERGYWSATKATQLDRWFGPTQRRLVPGLVIPTYDHRGEVAFCQLRPDQPRVDNDHVRKYEIPAKARMVVDVPPRVRSVLGDPSVPLVITEGAKKADAAVTAGLAAVDLIGVWNWRGTNSNGGKAVLPDFEHIAFNDRVIYLCFDSDAWENSSVHLALSRLHGVINQRHARMRVIYLPTGDAGAKTGLDDYLAGGRGRDDLLALATDVLRPPPQERSNGHRKPLPRNIDGARLLADLRAFISGYMVLPSDEVADLLALWTLHTWMIKAAFATPYLRIVSAAADSGKTLLLELLAAVCRNGWHAINPSTAVLYRKIDKQQPTVLLDEMDNYPVDDRRDALSVLNAGYKIGATVDRCKDNGDLETFKCFCAKAYAGLDQKSLVSTLLSRSVTIRLERKKAGEQRDRWIAPLCEPKAVPLRDRCEAWAHHHVDAVRDRQPELPAVLVNRAAEVWWALLAIAEEVGGDWPERARQAATVLSTGGDAVDDVPDHVRLLTDIRDAFNGKQTIFTKELLEKLNGLDESPWGARRRGEGLNARGLSGMLRPYKIRPRTVRVGDETAKGYQVEQFADAFARHLPDPLSEASQASHPSQPNVHGGSDVTDETSDPSQKDARGMGDVTDVTDVTDKSGADPPRCCCVDGGAEPAEDGRCSRCWGWPK